MNSKYDKGNRAGKLTNREGGDVEREWAWREKWPGATGHIGQIRDRDVLRCRLVGAAVCVVQVVKHHFDISCHRKSSRGCTGGHYVFHLHLADVGRLRQAKKTRRCIVVIGWKCLRVGGIL